MRIGIVADDLTGAADAIAPFARIGKAAGVGFARNSQMAYGPPDVNALALDTETRELPSDKATTITRLTRAATRGLLRNGTELFVKKIDSTLRGHLRTELDAMRRELPGRIALVCPAFPACGRVVRGGMLYVNGAAWHKTAYAPPAFRQTSGATVRTRFGYHGDETAAELTNAVPRPTPESLRAALDAPFLAGVTTVFLDAESDADLDIIAQIVLAAPERFLPVGSAGLAHALAARLPPDIDGTAQNAQVLARLMEHIQTRPVVVAVGSRNPVSRGQAAFLAQHGEVVPIILSPTTMKTYQNPAVAAICEQFVGGQRVALVVTSARKAKSVSLNGLAALFGADSPVPIPGFVVTGGASAVEMLSCLGGDICSLRIAGEIEPGIVIGQLHSDRADTPWHGLPIVLKAGGFGDNSTLARIIGLS